MLVYTYSDDARAYIDAVASLFELLRKRGLLALRDLPSKAIITEDTGAVVLLFRHAVALLDSLVALSDLPSVEALRIVMRSFLETKCSLEYMIQEHMLERSVAYQTQHIMRKINLYQSLDPSTNRGKQFQAQWDKDRIVGSERYEGIDTSKAMANLESQLRREPYRTAHRKLSSKNVKHWYSLDGGPANFESLCGSLGYQIYYEHCYRLWSSYSHGTSGYVDSFFASKGGGQMHAIRALDGYQATIELSLKMIVNFFQEVFRSILPEHSVRFERFYKNQFRPVWKKQVEGVRIVRTEPTES